MYPVLFEVGPIVVRSYGVMMAIGFAAGTFWLVRRGIRRGMGADRMIDLVIAIIVSSLVGARVFYVATHPTEFAGAWWRVFWPVQADGSIGIQGLVFYGGLLLAVPTTVLLARRWRLGALGVLDAVAPPLALGTAIGRVGCFLNGCCFGIPTECPWGVVFPAHSLAGAAFPGTPLHPTQLYMVADNLIIMSAALFVESRWRKFDGIVFGAYLTLSGLARSIEDLFRYYEGGMRLFTLGDLVISVNHLISLLLVAGGLLLIFMARKRIPVDLN